MTGSYGIEPRYLEAIRGIIAEFPRIEKVWLYGSRARGDWRPDSDIDLAIDGDLFHFADLLDLRARLEELPLIFKIDIMPLNGLENEQLRNSIYQSGTVFYERGGTL